MKTIKIFSIAVLLCTAVSVLHAQSNRVDKPLIVHTMYLNAAAGNRNINVDSLLTAYKQKVIDGNSYFTSAKLVRHWWGNDSRQVLFIYELKSWDDIEKAFNMQHEMEQQFFTSNNGAAGKLWTSLFLPEHHSDEIYRVVQ